VHSGLRAKDDSWRFALGIVGMEYFGNFSRRRCAKFTMKYAIDVVLGALILILLSAALYLIGQPFGVV
jgi:hypothetical protein